MIHQNLHGLRSCCCCAARSARPSASRTWRRCRACAPTSSSATAWWSGSTAPATRRARRPSPSSRSPTCWRSSASWCRRTSTPQLKNVAAVSVHAVMPAFVKPGQTIDITVNSIANAKSLRGGSLLVTPLHGLDGQIYAIAQGNLIVSGFGVEGNDGSKLTVNVPSSGRIPERRDGRARRAHADRAGRCHRPQSERSRLHHGDAPGGEREQGHGRRRRHASSTAGRCACRAPIDITQRVAFLSTVENLRGRAGERARPR